MRLRIHNNPPFTTVSCACGWAFAWDGRGAGGGHSPPGSDTEKCKAQLAAAFPGPVHWEGRSSPESHSSLPDSNSWFQFLSKKEIRLNNRCLGSPGLLRAGWWDDEKGRKQMRQDSCLGLINLKNISHNLKAESCFFHWELLVHQAREAASQRALRNCSQEVGGGRESGYVEVCHKRGG